MLSSLKAVEEQDFLKKKPLPLGLRLDIVGVQTAWEKIQRQRKEAASAESFSLRVNLKNELEEDKEERRETSEKNKELTVSPEKHASSQAAPLLLRTEPLTILLPQEMTLRRKRRSSLSVIPLFPKEKSAREKKRRRK